jgi:hypothetical protein
MLEDAIEFLPQYILRLLNYETINKRRKDISYLWKDRI